MSCWTSFCFMPLCPNTRFWFKSNHIASFWFRVFSVVFSIYFANAIAPKDDSCPASLGLIWVMVCSVELYVLVMLSICFIHLISSWFNESNLLYELSLKVVIIHSAVWTWVVSNCLNRLAFIIVKTSIHFADLIEYYSSEYNCFGFPIEINICLKPIIIASGDLFLVGTTSAILV